MPSVPHLDTTSTVAASPAAAAAASPISRTVVSTQFFFKDGRKIRVGDCALFKPPQDELPPFIGRIRCLSSNREGLRLGVNWLYRPAEVILGKGSLLEAAPNEIFYSFHTDEALASSLLHPCRVSFLRKGVELPSGICSFVCRRVYDPTDKRLWWLTDKDYTNERQAEVDKLLDKTRLEMHSQSGGRSPKPLNSPTSVTQLRSNSVQNISTSPHAKGKKRERVDQGAEPVNRERYAVTDDVDLSHLRSESIFKSEMDKILKGGLVDDEGVEKLVQLMQLDKTDKKLDLASRKKLADVLASTDRFEYLVQFVQLRGLSVLDEWLQEVHKGKIHDNSVIKESDHSVEDFLFALLRALDKMPVNLHALQNCNVGKSVNNLRSYKNLEIQKKARTLVDTWKKRVEAEMKVIDAKSQSSQAVSWPSKTSPSEVSQGGNRRPGPTSVVPMKVSVTQPSTCKTVSVKYGQTDGSLRASPSPKSVKTSTCFTAAVSFSSKDMKEERSSSSSQSQTNSQSCSSEHIKTAAFAWKEDVRCSTAGSSNMKRTSSSTARQRSSSGILAPVSGFQKDTPLGKSESVTRSTTPDKLLQSSLTCERALGVPVGDHGNSQRLIVRLTNPGRSPTQNAGGCSHDNSTVMVNRVSSLGPSEKHDQNDLKVKGKCDFRPNIVADVNAESWQSNDGKDKFIGADEGDASPATISDGEQCRSSDEIRKPIETSIATCSSTRRDKGVSASVLNSGRFSDANLSSITALIESCMKHSEADACIPAGDDGMNLLASVAAGETSATDLILPVGINGKSSSMPEDFPLGSDSKSRLSVDDVCLQSNGKFNDGAHAETKRLVNTKKPGSGNMLHVDSMDLPVPTDQCSKSDGESDVRAAASQGVSTAAMDEEDAQVEGANPLDGERMICPTVTDGDGPQALTPNFKSPLSDESKMPGKADEKTTDSNLTSALDCVHGSKPDGCDIDNEISNGKDMKEAVEESSSSPSLKVDDESKHVHEGSVVDSSKEKGHTAHDANLTEGVEEHTDKMMLHGSNELLNPDSLNEQNSKKSDDGETRQEKYIGQTSNVSLTSNDQVGAVNRNADDKDKSKRRKIIECCTSGSHLHEELSTSPIEGTGPCMKSSGSKVSGVDADEKEECASNAEASSVSVALEKPTMLDFDLNETFPADEESQGDSVSSTAPVHQPSSLSYPVSSMTNNLTGLITVSAAKGAFLSPENLLKSTVELGWRGSAATSAFRPAEPRKIFGLPLGVAGCNPDTPVNTQNRTPLDFDLNVPDERLFEDIPFSRSGTNLVSEQGVDNYRNLGPSMTFGSPAVVIGTELGLDLNRINEGSNVGKLSATVASSVHRPEEPLLSVRSSPSGVFPNGGMNAMKNIDLNSGPGIDEVGSEPVLHGHHEKSTFPPITDFRTTNGELGVSWFPPSNSYSAVSLPHIQPERGEQTYSFVGTAGSQRLLGPVTGSTTVRPDVYGGPVFSSSPALSFSPPCPLPYPGFPYNSGVLVPSTSATYPDSSSTGGLCFPAFPSQLVGPAGAVSTTYARPYMFNLSNGSVNAGADSSMKWGRQGLDLNAGPGGTDMDARDDRFSSLSRQLPIANSNTLLEERMRLHQAASGILKRKEPEGGWGSERFSFKQPSWQ